VCADAAPAASAASCKRREQASYQRPCASPSSNPIGAGAVNRGPRTIAEKAYVPGPSNKCDPKHRPTMSGKNEPELKGQPARESTKERRSSCVPIVGAHVQMTGQADVQDWRQN
jgi:hypothetical protein